MTLEEMKPSGGFFFVYVGDDGPVRSDEMSRDQLLFVIEDLLKQRDADRVERRSMVETMFDLFRRHR